jgi:peroxiredoxin
METAGAPLLEELRTPPINLISDDLARNRSLTHEAERAKLRGEETLSPGGHNVRCYVVDVPPRAGGSHRLWVDEQRYIVLQDEWISPPGSQPDVVGPYRSYLVDSGDWISQLTEADLGPISNDVFQFVVPSGAADSFSVPSGFAQALETALACLLLGSTMEEYVQGPEWPLHVWDDPVLRTQYRLQGTKARDFTLGTLGGENVRLEASRGKIVVLDFWASWCEPCQGELAALQKLHDELGSQGVVFLGIDEESSQTIEDYVKAHGCTFPMLLDPEQTVHQLYGVRCVPTTVVIDRKGKIAAHYVGARGEAQLRRALKSAGLKTTP